MQYFFHNSFRIITNIQRFKEFDPLHKTFIPNWKKVKLFKHALLIGTFEFRKTDNIVNKVWQEIYIIFYICVSSIYIFHDFSWKITNTLSRFILSIMKFKIGCFHNGFTKQCLSWLFELGVLQLTWKYKTKRSDKTFEKCAIPLEKRWHRTLMKLLQYDHRLWLANNNTNTFLVVYIHICDFKN